MMNLKIKRFNDLTVDELYQILRLRVSVFVVEQHCAYPEIDDLDQDAIHVWFEDENGIEAYLRILDRDIENEHCAIGRVIAVKRRCGLGSRIMREGIRVAVEQFSADAIYLEAQTYAREFYEQLGFKQVSDEFALDGIPHVKMLLKIS